MSHVYSNALTISPLPYIAPLPAGMFITPAGLSWYDTSITPLPASLFSTPVGLIRIMILVCGIRLVLERVNPAKHIIQIFRVNLMSNYSLLT